MRYKAQPTKPHQSGLRFPFFKKNSALDALELVYSGGNLYFRRVEIKEFIFFSPVQSFNFLFFPWRKGWFPTRYSGIYKISGSQYMAGTNSMLQWEVQVISLIVCQNE